MIKQIGLGILRLLSAILIGIVVSYTYMFFSDGDTAWMGVLGLYTIGLCGAQHGCIVCIADENIKK